jgi:Sulfate permease and related transporters (MFS superfamily)
MEDDVAGAPTSATTAKAAKRQLPIFEGLLPFDPARVPSELIAGATLGALAIPETMGYAAMAGMPPITGLYTLVIPLFLFAIFGSSRHLVVGADSATAVVLFAGLTGLGLTASSTEWVATAGLAALMVAVVLVAARMLRLGFIANFLSRSVLIGFLTGVGIQVAMGQLHGVLGVSDGSGTTLQKFWTTLQNIPATSIPTLAVSVAVWVIILGSGRISKKIPGALIAVVGMILISFLGLLPSTVTLLGAVPAGLPAIGLPQGVISQANIVALLPIVFSCFIIILAQSAATSRAYAVKYDDSFNENVDLIGLGLANIGAGMSGTFVVNGSPTKTEMVDGAGGKTQLAQVTAGLIVVVVLLFLTGALAYMPNAVLAAVVLLIGLRLIDIVGMKGIASVRTGEFVVAALTAATVVVVGIEQAITLAIVLSMIEHLSHAYRPYDTTLAITPEGRLSMAQVSSGIVVQAEPGLVIYRFGAGLYYANAARFMEEIVQILDEADPKVEWFCLSGAAIGDIDYSGAGALRQVASEIKKHGATFVLCELEPSVLDIPARYGIQPEIGGIYPFIEDVIAAYKDRGVTP